MYAPLKCSDFKETKIMNYEHYLESSRPSSYSLAFQVFAGRSIGSF